MAQISKRIRFEILKRDNYSCTYCGAKAPEVVLHVDHVIPESLGGANDPSNLTTACRDCNLGKSSSHPDDSVVRAVDLKAIEWAQVIQQAASEIAAETHADEVAQVTTVFDGWFELTTSHRSAIRGQIEAGLPVEALVEAASIARYADHVETGQAFRYFMGICRNMREKLYARAEAITEQKRREAIDQREPSAPIQVLDFMDDVLDEIEAIATGTSAVKE